MPKQKPTKSKRTRAGSGRSRGPQAQRSATRNQALMVRIPDRAAGRRTAETAALASAAEEARVPEATISRTGAPVSVEILFGHAQHGKYTIQLFEPRGETELTRQAGLSTDEVPDRFELGPSPAQLDQHIVQWSGAVSAFTSAPGQRFSVIFDVTQGGSLVPGGHVERTGPLAVTQVFLGILRLVAR